MKKLAYTALLSLSALLIAFGLTAGEAPKPVDRAEVALPEESAAPEGEAAEVAEILVNGDAEPASGPETGEPIDAQVTVCNCKLGPQPYNQCPAGSSCQACPCLSSSSKIDGVCK